MSETSQEHAKVCSYRAFWHLEAVGVLKAEFREGKLVGYASPVWRKLETAAAATVALIDTGVSLHPYLKNRIIGQIDLTGLPMQASEAALKGDLPFKGMDRLFLIGLGLDRRLPPDDFSWLVRFVEANAQRVPFDFGAPDTANTLFSSHGTACAGLIVASADDASTGRADDSIPAPLAYSGVDPFSTLLSITTTFAPRPETLILAFLCAAFKEVDVILVPRSISGEVMEVDESDADPEAAGDARRRAWRTLRTVIVTVSESIPVVCASGNDAESRLIAPAALATENEGRNGIIAVGAISYEGIRSSYSSYGPGLTLVGPSDDGEMFNEDQARFDKTDRFFGDYPYKATARRTGVGEVTYSQASVLAIDIPGAFGFEASGNQLATANEPITQFSGFFTEFGGTSAAASIVAGVAALVQRASKLKNNRSLRGPEVRKILAATARKEGSKLPHDDGSKVPTPDIINQKGGKEPLTFEQAFGAGVADADAAVSELIPTTA
jgi:subtilisin family serine protease